MVHCYLLLAPMFKEATEAMNKMLILLKIEAMKTSLTVLGIFAICVIVLIVYLIRKNLKDKEEVTKSFTEKFKDEKKFKLDDDEF